MEEWLERGRDRNKVKLEVSIELPSASCVLASSIPPMCVHVYMPSATKKMHYMYIYGVLNISTVCDKIEKAENARKITAID